MLESRTIISARESSAARVQFLAIAALLGLTSILLLFRLSAWPIIWHDEGLYLQVSKNLALSGQYATHSSEGFRVFDPIIGTGPTVLAPIALLFGLNGIDLFWGRAVIAVYALLAVLSFFLVVQHTFDLKTAIVASLLLLITPPTTDDTTGMFLTLSRTVMGEVPALFFLLAGTFLWYKALDSSKLIVAVGSGLLFGLAVVTKLQFLLVFAGLALLWVLDRLWYRRSLTRAVLVPMLVGLACVAAWYGLQSSLSNATAASAPAASGLVSAHLSFLSPRHVVSTLRTLSSSGALIWGIPGLVYVFYHSRGRDLTSVKRMFLLVVCSLWLAWYIFGSVGWLRYAFVPLTLLNVFAAKLLVDLADGFDFFKRTRAAGQGISRALGMLNVRSLAIALAVFFMLVAPLFQRVKEAAGQPDRSAAELAAYIDQEIPSDAVIETAEAEIAFLSNSNFHQPPVDVRTLAIEHSESGTAYPDNYYVFEVAKPDYLVTGWFAGKSQLYRAELEHNQYLLEKSIGAYDLYRRVR